MTIFECLIGEIHGIEKPEINLIFLIRHMRRHLGWTSQHRNHLYQNGTTKDVFDDRKQIKY